MGPSFPHGTAEMNDGTGIMDDDGSVTNLIYVNESRCHLLIPKSWKKVPDLDTPTGRSAARTSGINTDIHLLLSRTKSEPIISILCR